MMTFPDMQSQIEVAHWGWDIAIFLWLVGLSGMGSFAYFWLRRAPLAYMTLITVVIGLAVVFSHLSRWWNLPVAIFHAIINFSFNWHSWMMIGIALLSVQMLLTLVLSLYHFDLLKRFPALANYGWATAWLKWIPALARSNGVLAIMAAFGVLVTIYSGFLLTQAVGVPLWNTALIPILWVFSAGVAVLDVLDLFHLKGWIEDAIDRMLMKLTLVMEAIKLMMLGAFVYVGLSASTPGARAGTEALVSGDLAVMFWFGVVLFGALIPMLAVGYSLGVRKYKAVIAVGAVLGLIGGLLLRSSVLMAGKFDTLVL
jgi:protein NrfD